MTEIMKITIEEAIQQLEFDRAMIRFDATTGKEISLEMLKSGNQDNYLTYVADGVAIKALEEIQQYREIGTVEECREAREKQKPKKIIRIVGRYPYKCPTCNGKLEIGYRHCIICGQLLRYPYENLEGMEDVISQN